MRQSLTSHAAESIYKAIVLLKMLYCSVPTLNISNTMGKKFKNPQESAIKIIHHRSEYDQERRYMTIINLKKFKADLLIFKYLQGTNIQNLCVLWRRVNLSYGTRSNRATLRVPRVRTEVAKSPFGSKAHFGLMNYELTFEVWTLGLQSFLTTVFSGRNIKGHLCFYIYIEELLLLFRQGPY